MASQTGFVPAKLSFAKVAAMHAPKFSAATANMPEDIKPRSSNNSSLKGNPQNSSTDRALSPTTKVGKSAIEASDHDQIAKTVTGAIEGLSLVKETSKMANGTASAESGDSLEDDRSHLSNSSLKQQSFDTKSMASVTTFAMDEKESIRPDDSASVRAVDDDEPTHSLSRYSTFQNGSDVSMPSLRGGARKDTRNVTIAPRRFHTLTLSNPPRFGDLPVSPILENDIPGRTIPPPQPAELTEDRSARPQALPVSPDEKLLEALATPKDRLSILQLEEKLLAFISQSRDDFIDLPPQNSFARLLAHKLADYYNLAHRINEDGTSIRIFKTPCLSLPTSLATFAKAAPIGSIQQSGVAVKIMRRAGLSSRHFFAGGSTAASSSVPSKTTSEAGIETTSDEGFMSPIEGTPNKDDSKLTREEREARYKAARERIFGDFQESATSESASTGENSASLSRSSSSSGKRKTRRHKTPKDDSFEARSAFVASYSGMQVSSMQSQYSQQYAEQNYQTGYAGSPNSFTTSVNYGSTPTQTYPGFDQPVSFGGSMSYNTNGQQGFMSPEAWQNMQSPSSGGYFSYPQNSSAYQQSVSSMMSQPNNHYIQQQAPTLQQSQNWTSGQFPNSYQAQSSPANSNAAPWAGYGQTPSIANVPSYQYGQLPPPNYPGKPTFNPEHPVPGSYTRSLFNPQTRSFVPNNTSNRSGTRSGRKKNSPASGQNRTSNVPKPLRSESPTSTRDSDGVGVIPSLSKPKEDSLQSRYGAPSHLPKKPPPSQVPSTYDVESISNVTPTGPLVVNGAIGNIGSGPSA